MSTKSIRRIKTFIIKPSVLSNPGNPIDDFLDDKNTGEIIDFKVVAGNIPGSQTSLVYTFLYEFIDNNESIKFNKKSAIRMNPNINVNKPKLL